MKYTDPSQLSEKRRAEWEAASPGGERYNLLKIYEVEDEMAAANAAPSKEDGNNNESAQEVVKESVSGEASNAIENETHNQDDTQSVEYWQKVAQELAEKAEKEEEEAKRWKQRKSDADRHLEPVQQENAKLRKENSALSDKLDRLEAMLEKLSANTAPQKPVVFIDPNDEFAQNYGEIAERLEIVKAQLREEMRSEFKSTISPLQDKLSHQERASEQEQEKARQAAHYMTVKTQHPDIEDFIGQKYGPALLAWGQTQAPIVGRILSNPYGYEPEDLCDVLTRFKVSSGLTKQAKSPSHADIASKVNSHTNVAQPPLPADVFGDDFGEKELNAQLAMINRRTFDSGSPVTNRELQQKAMDDLLTKWERTLNKRLK